MAERSKASSAPGTSGIESRKTPAVQQSTAICPVKAQTLTNAGEQDASRHGSTSSCSLNPSKSSSLIAGASDSNLQYALQENRGTVVALKRENKDLRDKKRQSSSVSEDGEMERLRERVQSLRQQLDSAKQRNRKLHKVVNSRWDQAKELETASERSAEEDNELTRQIRGLEEKLRRMTERHTEAQTAKKTYQQLLKRLKEEHVGSDDKLASLENSLSSKQQSLNNVSTTYHGANHAREASMRMLDDASARLEHQREQQERELGQLTKQVSAKRGAIEKLEQQVRRMTVGAIKHEEVPDDSESSQVDADHSGKGESRASDANMSETRDQEKQLIRSTSLGSNVSDQDDTERSLGKMSQRRISVIDEDDADEAVFERTFSQLSNKLGVTEPEQLIGKIKSQEQSLSQLQELSKEANEKIERLQKQRAEKKAELNELRYSSEETPMASKSKRAVEEVEQAMADARQQSARAKERHERAASELVKLRAGVSQLCERLSVTREGEPEQVLDECEEKLMKLSKQAKDAPSSPRPEQLEYALPKSNFRLSLTNEQNDGQEEDGNNELDEQREDEEATENVRVRTQRIPRSTGRRNNQSNRRLGLAQTAEQVGSSMQSTTAKMAAESRSNLA